MINEKHKTAAYKIIPSQGGNRYSFFCELSGMLVCTTGTYYADNPEAELSAAWEAEGKKNFNFCHMCGRWVDSIVYNPDMLVCVDCIPLEEEAKYCKYCGARAKDGDIICPVCGKICYTEGLMKLSNYTPSRKEILKHFGFGTENMKRLKICPCCGNAQAAKNKFCEVCHTRLHNETLFDIYKAKHRCCTRCGNILPDDTEYCPMCGTKQKNKEKEAI